MHPLATLTLAAAAAAAAAATTRPCRCRVDPDDIPTGAPRLASRAAPNILLVVSDDVDRRWVGAYRSAAEHEAANYRTVTPTIDGMAADGAIFRNAYTTASTCSPSRYALLTGRYPSRATSTDYRTADVPANVKLPDGCETSHRLNGTVVDVREDTLAHHLQAAGYVERKALLLLLLLLVLLLGCATAAPATTALLPTRYHCSYTTTTTTTH